MHVTMTVHDHTIEPYEAPSGNRAVIISRTDRSSSVALYFEDVDDLASLHTVVSNLLFDWQITEGTAGFASAAEYEAHTADAFAAEQESIDLDESRP